jgi:superfamily II DNA/RNA helicase
LDIRGISYEHLHGGVPSDKRKELFDRFNTDPNCRVFLSTDAGSTGLNLQSASMLINLDLPWNPAVLEQRISRIHRLGQKNKVSIINFVARLTIEHKMLSVLHFKSALAQGVLDNGEDVIFMDKDSFSKFMETVEAVTGDFGTESEATVSVDEALEPMELALPEHVTDAEEAAGTDVVKNLPEKIPEQLTDRQAALEEMPQIEGDDDIAPVEVQALHRETSATPVPSGQPAATEPQDLLTNGIRFLSGLAQTLSSPEATDKLLSSIVERDEKTGRSYVKIPVDDQQIVANAINLIGQLFKNFGK